jgi:hypothetical protein
MIGHPMASRIGTTTHDRTEPTIGIRTYRRTSVTFHSIWAAANDGAELSRFVSCP